jgi:hypothetical protein
VNGGVGGQVTTPIGAVADLPGQYGRVIPNAAYGIPSTSFLKGHVNQISGVSYLRIAQAHATSWFGGTGNTTGGGGVNMRQNNIDGDSRHLGPGASQPAFSNQLVNVVLFKFKITLDPSNASLRTMLVDLPLQGVYPGSAGFPYVSWWINPFEVVGSLRELPTISTASILVNVPGPATPLLLGMLLIPGRRRKSALPREAGAPPDQRVAAVAQVSGKEKAICSAGRPYLHLVYTSQPE